MTINEQIFIVANQLANQGKKPSVALIKNKLATPTPLPTIINALKVWQHDPNFISLEQVNKSQTKQSSSTASIEQQIAKALVPIQQEVLQLKTEIELLKKRLNSK